MNEGDKETARFRTNYVLKKPAGQVVIDLMLQYVLAVLQWAGIASGWRGGIALFQIIISRVGKAQHQAVEVFVVDVFLGKQLQHFVLNQQRRREAQAAFSFKHGPSNFP